MLCPLAKSNGMLAMAGAQNIDADVLRKQAICNGPDCGWWHSKLEQCAIMTIAQSIDRIDDREAEEKAERWR